MSKIKFGTDGWRAIIARDFTFSNCRVTAQGIAAYLNCTNLAKKGVIIGYDNRFMSKEFAEECARVLVGNGIKTFMLNKVSPTPVTAYAVHLKGAGGGLMITASHNPAEYNGIKYIPYYAGPALPEVTDAIEKEINRVKETGKIYELDLAEAMELSLYQRIEADNEYFNHIRKLIEVGFLKKRKIKVVSNPMYGAGVGYLDQILTELGCEVRTINNHRDVLFGGSMPEPISKLLGDLKRAVVSYNADIGLALDGDADRFGIIDSGGNFISANHIMPLLLEHLLSTRKWRGPVCRSVGTTHMLDKVARSYGLSVIETPVGFKYISEALREKGCIMGCEESGGMSIFGHIPEKDGILGCLLAVEMLAYTGKSLVELAEEFKHKYGQSSNQRMDIKVDSSDQPEILENIEAFNPKTIAGAKVDSILETDGRKIVLEDDSWILIRYSGTEPVFRIYVEAENEGRMMQLQEEVLVSLGIKTKI
ncbi:MAG: phosphoglucomutase/phosphomannomutase family protein [Syntrophomonadaceae bacterium]|jgi:alpha-D-glucose phosphate-specific phosphoglucomutase|nr:phosphoglucomutase/phosphomannomutase family protein [Syntrophomonadaceae bacterium]